MERESKYCVESWWYAETGSFNVITERDGTYVAFMGEPIEIGDWCRVEMMRSAEGGMVALVYRRAYPGDEEPEYTHWLPEHKLQLLVDYGVEGLEDW